MIHRSLSAVVLLLFFSFSTEAQQKLTLTIEEATRLGLESSKALHTSHFKLDAAAAKAAEANTLSLPSLKFNRRYTRLSNVPPEAVSLPANSFGPGFPPSDLALTLSPTILDNYTLRATLQQPLFTGQKYPAPSRPLITLPAPRNRISAEIKLRSSITSKWHTGPSSRRLRLKGLSTIMSRK